MGVSDITSVNIIECYVLSGKPHFNKQLIANISPTTASFSSQGYYSGRLD